MTNKQSNEGCSNKLKTKQKRNLLSNLCVLRVRSAVAANFRRRYRVMSVHKKLDPTPCIEKINLSKSFLIERIRSSAKFLILEVMGPSREQSCQTLRPCQFEPNLLENRK